MGNKFPSSAPLIPAEWLARLSKRAYEFCRLREKKRRKKHKTALITPPFVPRSPDFAPKRPPQELSALALESYVRVKGRGDGADKGMCED